MNTHLARGFTHNSNVFPVYLTSRKSRVVSLHVYAVVTLPVLPQIPCNSSLGNAVEFRAGALQLEVLSRLLCMSQYLVRIFFLTTSHQLAKYTAI